MLSGGDQVGENRPQLVLQLGLEPGAAGAERLVGVGHRELPVEDPGADRLQDLAQLSLRPGPAAKLLLASVTSAASTMLRIYLLFLALQLGNVPLLAIISSTALIAILQALPISFSGIGVRDAILIAVLARYGYTAELALILSALFLLLNIEHMLIGFLVSLRYPLGAQPDASLSGEPREPAASG